MKIVKANILTFIDDPFKVGDEAAYRYIKNGGVFIEKGIIQAVDDFDILMKKIGNTVEVVDFSGNLLMPGFIDTHVHYPQTPMIAGYGEQLLEWLEKYTFPTELKFKDKAYAVSVAKKFLKFSLMAGTTTSVVYGTVYKDSVDAFFEESERLGTRMLCGKVWMDRNAPEDLLDNAETAYIDSKALIEKWHKKGRQLYVITPRFAPSCSGEQLQKAGELYQEYDDLYIQTHLCENKGEIAWVKELFPDRKSYTDVYDYYGLVQKRAIFGHCVHFNDDDYKTLHNQDASISHCPTSNLFLGSGLFDINRAKKGAYPVRLGLGTDIGAGTSFCHLQTLNEAYKVAQLRGQKLTAIQGMYLATRGGAESLSLENTIGSIQPECEADMVVLDLRSTPLLDYRMSQNKHLEESLFTEMIMADDRAIKATIVNGKVVYNRDTGYFYE